MIQTEFDVLEKNIQYWKKIIIGNDMQDLLEQKKILGEHKRLKDIERFNAKEQLARIQRKYGTTEMWEIKDLYR
tara:strand:+ start:76 stop:297 length:222 start_codon:yes stop_codon:yes gene_type:complete